jgi:ABC-type phosphate transport system substrate-binding protein
MTARTNLVKSSLLALGLGAALSSSGVANAQSIVYCGGGSSGLQGSYGNPPALGAIPSVIVNFTGNLSSFTAGAGTTTQGIITAQAYISGEPGNGGHTDALILYTSAQASSSNSAASTNIIILIRSDSGFGVRYVANKESITSWTFTNTFSFASPPVAHGATNLDTAVENYLTANVGATEAICNGLSDVDADTIATYAGFGSAPGTGLPINTAGLGGQHDLTPVQTVCFLYNKTHALGNITRTQAKSVIAGLPSSSSGGHITWGELLCTANTDPVDAYYRESTSGTRNTELLNVQRSGPLVAADIFPGNFNSFASILTENLYTFDNVTDSGAAGSNYAVNGGNNANGTGAMVNAVNNDTNGFGYAFLTGSPGSKSNVEVASFDGVYPLDKTSFPVLADGGQTFPSSYPTTSTTSLYPTVVWGIYEVWAFSNQYQCSPNPQSACANQIVSLLDSVLTEKQVHSLGFTRISDMMVTRVATSGVTIPSDNVTDGQLITYDMSAGTAGGSGNFGASTSVLQTLIQ